MSVSFVCLVLLTVAGCGGAAGGGGGDGSSSGVNLLTTDIPAGATGLLYEVDFEATFPNAPGAFRKTSGQIPDGLEFDGRTGRLSGYPHQVGRFRFEIEAYDGLSRTAPRDFTVAADRESYVLDIARGPLSFVPQTVPAAQYRGSYSYAFDVAGGTAPYVFQKTGGELPNGLSLSAQGVLGTFPTQAREAPYVFEVTVTDANGETASETFEVRVVVLPLLIATSSLPDAAQDFPYTHAITLASGGAGAPYTWSQVFPLDGDTDLASIGMEIKGSDGTLQPKVGFVGPSASGTFSFRVQVTDEATQVAVRALELRVNPGPVLTSITPSRSVQPGPYIVTGLNFQAGAALVFSPEGVATEIVPTFVDSTTLRFNTAPPVAQSGSVTVRVRNPDSGFDDLEDAFLFPYQNIAFDSKGFLPSTLSSMGLDAGDLNGDGKVEIVHCGASGVENYSGGVTSTHGGLHLLRNDGGLTFTLLTLDGANYYDVKFVDLNVDGKLDVAGLTATQIKTFINSSGVLAPGPSSALPAGYFAYPAEMAIGFFNGDSIPDVAFGVSHYDNIDGQVHTMTGTGTGAFTIKSSSAFDLMDTNGVISLACVDFSGDGRSDVFAGQGWVHSFSAGPLGRASVTTASGTLGSWTTCPNDSFPSPGWGNTLGAIAGDFLGTGTPNQVLVMHSQDAGDGGGRNLAILSGSGLGTKQNLTPPATIGKSLAAKDVDLDGRVDFVVSTHTGGLTVYKGATHAQVVNLNTATGTPTVSGPRTGRVAFGDLDGDGREDLLATTSYWATDMQGYYYSGFELDIAGNGGSMGVVYYLNSSD